MQQLTPEPEYEPIEMPRNSPTGVVTAFFATITGFALIWHIWWLMGIGLIAAYAVFVWFAWRDIDEYIIPAGESRASIASVVACARNGCGRTRVPTVQHERHQHPFRGWTRRSIQTRW